MLETRFTTLTGRDPRLSGSWIGSQQASLGQVQDRLVMVRRVSWAHMAEPFPVEHIGPDQARKAGQALDDALSAVGDFGEDESDQGDHDLDCHRIVGGAEEVAQLQGLLDPAEE